jgi:putative transposase
VKAKSGLNKSILDQGWGEFRRQLEYKQVWLGGDAKFACVECGYTQNADLNAAINILTAGHVHPAK